MRSRCREAYGENRVARVILARLDFDRRAVVAALRETLVDTPLAEHRVYDPDTDPDQRRHDQQHHAIPDRAFAVFHPVGFRALVLLFVVVHVC